MEDLWKVLLQATANGAPSLSCDECYVLMDYLSDLLAGGYSPQAVLPLAEKYLEHCPDCQDEYVHDLQELLLVPVENVG
ncbi:MAG: hypothetical protein M8467_06850 [Anaerolineae bacterium]|nr:hypothetical protein [Anaerolineae bacterium]